MLNETLDFDSEEEYRFTGTETRPNEMVAVAMERAGISVRLRVSGRSYKRGREFSTLAMMPVTFVMEGLGVRDVGLGAASQCQPSVPDPQPL
jgi:hypothetical protein